jgi:hypothetical protein
MRLVKYDQAHFLERKRVGPNQGGQPLWRCDRYLPSLRDGVCKQRNNVFRRGKFADLDSEVAEGCPQLSSNLPYQRASRKKPDNAGACSASQCSQ